MTPVGFEPTISADKRPQTHALDHSANGIGVHLGYGIQKYWTQLERSSDWKAETEMGG